MNARRHFWFPALEQDGWDEPDDLPPIQYPEGTQYAKPTPRRQQSWLDKLTSDPAYNNKRGTNILRSHRRQIEKFDKWMSEKVPDWWARQKKRYEEGKPNWISDRLERGEQQDNTLRCKTLEDEIQRWIEIMPNVKKGSLINGEPACRIVASYISAFSKRMPKPASKKGSSAQDKSCDKANTLLAQLKKQYAALGC